ncbi:MAG: SusC/RagA family TonB-linked outer membrane protein [Balneolaceae bacterium]|nr:MAG: SusC/RagA family TonB-linked outer membrane protein [Balneolaceae bacterium]
MKDKRNYLSVILLSGLLFSLSSITAIAQTITGSVTDAGTGEPLPSVSVMIEGTLTGTITNLNGEYEITVRSGEDVLVFSSIGFETTRIRVGDQTRIDVSLNEDTVILDELIVTGYTIQRRADVTTAISSVPNVQQQLNRPITNVADILQGAVPGVTVIREGGDPTRESNVIIRGQGTLGFTAPLWVVDGVPYDGPRPNPRDIESIEILKDAAAAAIYGARASSGVILVTTRRGESATPRVEIDYMRGYAQAVNLPSALTAPEYQAAQTNAHLHAGDPPPAGHNPLLNPWGAVQRTDWMNEIFRTAPYDNLNARVSGQYSNLNYMTSFGYQGEEGILRNTYNQRLSWRLKTDFDVNQWLRFGQNFYLNYGNFRGTNTTSDFSGVVTAAIFMNPAAPVYDPVTTFHGSVPFELSQFAGAYGDVYNPVALLERDEGQRENFTLTGNVYGQANIMDNLRFKTTFSLLRRTNSEKRFDPIRLEIGRSTPENVLTHYEGKQFNWLWDQQLDYLQNFGRHNVSLTAVYSADYRSFEDFSVNFRGFDNEADFFRYINNAGDTSRPGSAGAWEDIMLSMVAIGNYSFDDRYFVGASIRRDVSSRLPEGNRSDIFPSLSGAWKISSERFFDVESINMLKLRASWGEIGNINSVSRTAFANPLSSSLSHLGDPPVRPLSFFANTVANPNLKWERTETYNAGIDLHMYRDRLIFTAEYYEKFTRGVILRNAPNTHQGMGSGPLINAGDVSNKGIEFSATYRGQIRQFAYSIGGNFSKNNNELLTFGDYDADVIRHGDAVRGVLFPFQSEPGQPLRSFFLIPSNGIFQSQAEIDNYTGSNGTPIQPNARPGDLRFVDVNGDGRITSADKIYMGNAIPDITYGFNINLNYRDFDFSTFLQGVAGNKNFFGYKYNAYQAAIQPYNMDRRAMDAWTPQNTNTNIPVMSTQDPNNNYGTESDWYLYDASYLRIRNVTFGYTVPHSILSRVGSGVTARFYASVDNLHTFTSYPGMDPEIGDRIDSAFYPQGRTFVFGVNLGF